MRIHALAAAAKGAALTPFEYQAPELGPHDVLVKVDSCGICHSDVHMIDDDWRVSRYPLVPGHEVVGTVVRAGSALPELAPGDRVGVGWQRSACLAPASGRSPRLLGRRPADPPGGSRPPGAFAPEARGPERLTPRAHPRPTPACGSGR